ncbi:dUTP diphosphatase [uncultured Veillonella sp.]|uniref:dUTP diphosphatase n=1 Tax=uncultured Veillonella sp. TaxID=159268 RepID=UPI0025EA43B8|nr:hypothetical protein [uncultured Veillonella sp.]
MATTTKTTTTNRTTKQTTEEPILGIYPLLDDMKLPEFKTAGASCMDVYLPENVRIGGKFQFVSQPISLGFKLDIPEGYSVRLHMRSSIACDVPIQLANSTGIIDSDFTGEVTAFVRNLTNEAFYFYKDERVFQLELVKDERVKTKVLSTYDKKTNRGETSGSTGR